MDSAVCEISSSAAARTGPEVRAKAPNATAALASICRRVGVSAGAAGLLLSMILDLFSIASPSSVLNWQNGNTRVNYVQDHIFAGAGFVIGVILGPARNAVRRSYAVSRRSPRRSQTQNHR